MPRYQIKIKMTYDQMTEIIPLLLGVKEGGAVILQPKPDGFAVGGVLSPEEAELLLMMMEED
jgi:hypothetical protein